MAGPDRRARARHAAPRLPRDRPARRRASCSSRRPTGCSRASRRRCRPRPRARSSASASTPLLERTVVDIDEDGVTVAGAGRRDRADPGAHGDLGRRRRRRRAWPRSSASSPAPSSTAPAGSPSSPTSTLPGHPEVIALGDMVRVRDADGEAGSARRRAGRDAAGPLRGRRVRATACAAREPARSTTATRATWRRSAAPRRSPTSRASELSGFLAWVPGSSSTSGT